MWGPGDQEKKVYRGGVSTRAELEEEWKFTTKFNRVEVIRDLHQSNFSGMLGTKTRLEQD